MVKYGWRIATLSVAFLILGIALGYVVAIKSLGTKPLDVVESIQTNGQGLTKKLAASKQLPSLKQPVSIPVKGNLEKIQESGDRVIGFFIVGEALPIYSGIDRRQGESIKPAGTYLKPGSRIEVEIPKGMSGELKTGSYMAVLRLIPSSGPVPKVVAVDMKPLGGQKP